MKSPVEILNTEILSNRYRPLKELTIRMIDPNGKGQTIKREIYERGDAAAAILYNSEKGTVILINQFRLPTLLNGNESGMMREACAGMLDGELPEVCVLREILEETGYAIETVKSIGSIYVSPAGCTERIYLFVAPYTPEMKTAKGGGLEAEHEYIEIEEVSYLDALEMIVRDEIQDAKTIVLLYHLRIHGLM